MPRRPRISTGNYVYHVLNRAIRRTKIFETDIDYQAFEQVLEQTRQKVSDVRLLAYCIMPNHWHLVLWPKHDGSLSEYMRWLTVTHTQRYHAFHESVGMGPLYQGRFKSFPVQADGHFYTLCRYVERNALRANLVRQAENWRWCSLWKRVNNSADISLDKWPIAYPLDWVNIVNQPQSEAELASVAQSIKRGSPLGSDIWVKRTAKRLRLESTLRPHGRPKKI